MPRPIAALKRIGFWRWVLASLLGSLAGYEAWSVASRSLGQQPLYEVAWKKPGTYGEFSIAGPWLFTCEWDKQKQWPEKIEVRSLQDGIIRGHLPYEPAEPIQGFRTLSVFDHPRLGPDTLLQIWQSSGSLRVGYWQPRTNAREMVETFPVIPSFGPNVQVNASGDGKQVLQRHWLPLAPFLLLGTQGLPDVLAADFHSYVTCRDHGLGLNHVTLIRVRDSRTWGLLGSYSIASPPGNINDYILSWDGKYLLCTARGLGETLESFFTRYPPTSPQLRETLLRSTSKFRMVDSLSGQQLWEAAGMAIYLPSRRYPEYFHMISIELRDDDPSFTSNWAKLRHRRWFFLPDKRKLVEVPYFSDDIPARERVPGRPRLCRTVRERLGDETLSSEVTAIEFDLEGNQKEWVRYSFHGSAGGEPVEGTNQFISARISVPPGYKQWTKVVEDWPSLRWIPYTWSITLLVIDADAQEIYPLATTSRPGQFSWDTTADGRFFLVQELNPDNSLHELKVYGLPFPQLPWWRRWGPTGLGWTIGLSVGGVVLFVQRRKRIAATVSDPQTTPT